MIKASRSEIQLARLADARGAPGEVRRRTFLHQDGLLLSIFSEALEQRGLLQLLAKHDALSVADLAAAGTCHKPFLHVALRCLAQAGWLSREGTPGSDALTHCVNALGHRHLQYLERYRQVARFLLQHALLEKTLLAGNHSAAAQIAELIAVAVRGWDLDGASPMARDFHVCSHLEGALLIPTLMALWQLDELTTPWNIDAGGHIIHWFTERGWLDPVRQRWTVAGTVLLDQALHYGMVGSYLFMLKRFPQILYGTVDEGRQIPQGTAETHVDRRLNVVGSSHAHQRYFGDADQLFIDVFDHEALHRQPRFVADMGCGDGAWLAHIYELVRTRTRRGAQLQQFPLLMVGSDCNTHVLRIAGQALARAHIPAVLVSADVTHPEQFATELARHGLEMPEGLHVRAFIDHNRRYHHEPSPHTPPAQVHSRCSGTYLDDAGQLVATEQVTQDLVAFLQRWAPHVHKHGLIVLEAHCVDPSITAACLGDTHNVVFDSYHALSRQYPVDFNVFMEAAELAGLRPLLYRQRRYPSRLPFVAVSINRFVIGPPPGPAETGSRPNPEDSASRVTDSEWRPTGSEDLADGEALHHLVYEDATTDRPRAWCGAATGVLVERVLAKLTQRVAEIQRSPGERVLSVLDYGTGSGLFAIELRKAMIETGLERTLQEHGIRLHLALADLPSSWFAKGYQLLHAWRGTHFYSLRNAAAFVSLADIAPQRYDVAVASMVFHLLTPRALAAALQNLAGVLQPHGCLLWNAPDIAPAPARSILFHEANRRLRSRVLHYLEQPVQLTALLARMPPEEQECYRELPLRLQTASAALTEEIRTAARRSAERQVLPIPVTAADLGDALVQHFTGSLHTRSFEMRPSETLDAALIPSNQRLLAEITDVELRRCMIRLVMSYEVIPELHSSPARTADGYAVHWTFGEHQRRTD